MERRFKINRKARTQYLTFFLWIAVFFMMPISNTALSKDLKVCRTCEISSLSKAISSAAAHDVIRVQDGIYYENSLIIDKPLSLIAQGHVEVDGRDQGQTIIEVRSPAVKIHGFIFKNTGNSYLKELAGIRVKTTENCEIVGNLFQNTTYGIYFENSKSCVVKNNTFRGRAMDEASGGNGIHLWQGENIIIENNNIQGHRDGIYFEFVKNVTVLNNDVRKNIRYGLHFMSSNDCVYKKNIFAQNGAGVAVMYSRRIVMENNRFTDNNGVAAYGLLLKEIHEGQIQKNIFENNTIAIFMEGSNRNKFLNNKIAMNGWALRIMADCENNLFTKNDFIKNTFDVSTNSENNPNTLSENYWSQYNGYDINRDGIGDIPYRPVSLSSVIMENVDSSFILVKSFLLTMLDEIEKSLPDLIPEKMKDERPLIQVQNGEL
ncbi:MAG: nitrous oxide reductase family maturation protein NosD [Pseudobdellovibrionaceae bacterium]